MIHSIRGTVLETRQDAVVIEAAGVGYEIFTTPFTLEGLREGQEARLWTTFVVREDAQQLFGFARREDREVFDLLRSVNGVGPRTALAVLSQLPIDELARAVAAEDDKPFRQVSGVGPKTAKLIVVSLAGRMAAYATDADQEAQPPAAGAAYADVVRALTGLGWTEQLAQELVGQLSDGLSHADALKAALALRQRAVTGGARG